MNLKTTSSFAKLSRKNPLSLNSLMKSNSTKDLLKNFKSSNANLNSKLKKSEPILTSKKVLCLPFSSLIFLLDCGGNFNTQTSRDDLIPCGNCNNLKEWTEIVYLESCVHSFCKECLIKLIINSAKANKEAACFSCQKPITEYEKKVILSLSLITNFHRTSLVLMNIIV